MQTYTAKLQSVSPYSSSRLHNTPKLNDREGADAYEKRTWREKLTTDANGIILINPMAFKFGLSAAAKYIGDQIPGKGKRTYAKIFDSGIMIVNPLNTGIHKNDAQAVWVHVHANGVRGSGKRVMRCFPTLPEWKGELQIYVLDDLISLEILKKHLICAGQFKGVGQYRPENGGLNGRFEVKSIS